jgi:hypothetical protein
MRAIIGSVSIVISVSSVGTDMFKFAENCTSALFSNTGMLQCPLRALMCKVGSMAGLPLETAARDRSCHVFLSNFE